jgi:bifunctional DNA-binding transcriptional regulator/antitoxin component of YhaV-PrlF toxin-antitoxin module
MGKAFDVRVAKNGRLFLPKTVRDALGMAGSGTVVFSVEGDQVRLTSIRDSIGKARALYRQHVAADLTVDDFLAERRTENAADEA